MDEAEKMASLKKAYADVILNMAQESAARILVSERRAVGFQRSLFAAKDEAVSTLLRLKSVLESKIKEAEKQSLGQIRRIQELESQLNEAEDTIASLRTELKSTHDKLEKMKNLTGSSEVENMNTISCEDNSQEREISSHSALCYPPGSEQISTDKEDANSSPPAVNGHCIVLGNMIKAEEMGAENEFFSKPDLASMIMRSTEPELFRNGCTQRIRALEQNLLTATMPLEKTDNQSDFNCKLIEPENAKPERAYPVDTIEKGKSSTVPKEHAELKEIDQSKSRQVVHFFRRFSSGKQGKANHVKSTHRSDTEKISIDGCVKSPFQVVSEEPEKISSAPVSLVISKCSKRSKPRKVQPKASFRNEKRGILKNDKQRITRQGFKEQSCLDLDNQTLGNPSYKFGGKHGRDIGDPLLLTPEKEDISGDQNFESQKPHMDNSILNTPEKEVADDVDISACSSKQEKNGTPSLNSIVKEENTCESSGAPKQVGNDKFLKYTFRRKRKRGSSNSKIEDIFPGTTDATKTRAEDKQDILVESQKPRLMVESTRDSRRMAQVARQLISLSEKRW
ncbi:Myosin rod fragments domain-containing protein [Dioscorea alata]|uniref:Myosin rods domain-containing protein n=1 Tax=Dioscorea alata TaxID=55571 RepID=A0ACB7VKM9_DIOAL|nr:Myosin rod fragments domain-containing protein [Dioscorea alata]